MPLDSHKYLDLYEYLFLFQLLQICFFHKIKFLVKFHIPFLLFISKSFGFLIVIFILSILNKDFFTILQLVIVSFLKFIT